MTQAELHLYKGYKIRIMFDDGPESPRDWDNFGHMVCLHNQYTLGDSDALDDLERELSDHPIMQDYQRGEWEILCKAMDSWGYVYLPLYLYDHSGLSINTGGFSCPWDSGQVGFIYVSNKVIRDNFGIKRVRDSHRKQAIAILNGEVETYDQYLTGQVFGFIIEDGEGEELSSCWGFYGYEFCLESAKEEVDGLVEVAREKHQAQVKKWIKSKVSLEYRVSQ